MVREHHVPVSHLAQPFEAGDVGLVPFGTVAVAQAARREGQIVLITVGDHVLHRERPRGVSRRDVELEGRVAQHDDLAILHHAVPGGRGVGAPLVIPLLRVALALLQELPVRFRHADRCARNLLDPEGATVVVVMGVRDEHVPDLRGVEAELPDVVQKGIDRFGARRVDEHQPAGRGDQVGADVVRPNVVDVVENLERDLDVPVAAVGAPRTPPGPLQALSRDCRYRGQTDDYRQASPLHRRTSRPIRWSSAGAPPAACSPAAAPVSQHTAAAAGDPP